MMRTQASTTSGSEDPRRYFDRSKLKPRTYHDLPDGLKLNIWEESMQTRRDTSNKFIWDVNFTDDDAVIVGTAPLSRLDLYNAGRGQIADLFCQFDASSRRVLLRHFQPMATNVQTSSTNTRVCVFVDPDRDAFYLHGHPPRIRRAPPARLTTHGGAGASTAAYLTLGGVWLPGGTSMAGAHAIYHVHVPWFWLRDERWHRWLEEILRDEGRSVHEALHHIYGDGPWLPDDRAHGYAIPIRSRLLPRLKTIVYGGSYKASVRLSPVAHYRDVS
ncbi:hypothetical protein TruAng_008187 [Truncatella angustata]|nr:hypothetical protein TruAng_008187 [Truncatella angustata]